jgi:hypothetical protein
MDAKQKLASFMSVSLSMSLTVPKNFFLILNFFSSYGATNITADMAIMLSIPKDRTRWTVKNSWKSWRLSFRE